MDRVSGLNCFLYMIFLNAVTYDCCRREIWSIVWCDNRGKKYHQLKKLKVGHTFSEKVRMDYLASNIRYLHKEYKFWMNCKRIFAVTELIFSAVCLIGVFFAESYSALQYVIVSGAVQAIIVFIFLDLMGQFGVQNKYDRMRMAKKRRK